MGFADQTFVSLSFNSGSAVWMKENRRPVSQENFIGPVDPWSAGTWCQSKGCSASQSRPAGLQATTEATARTPESQGPEVGPHPWSRPCGRGSFTHALWEQMRGVPPEGALWGPLCPSGLPHLEFSVFTVLEQNDGATSGLPLRARSLEPHGHANPVEPS